MANEESIALSLPPREDPSGRVKKARTKDGGLAIYAKAIDEIPRAG